MARRRRRGLHNESSAEVVEYLVARHGMSQDDIADVLEVGKSFISRVRSAEREFSPRQLGALADFLGVPMGAMLIAAEPPSDKPMSPKVKELVDLAHKVMLQCDAADAAAKAGEPERAAKRAAVKAKLEARRASSSLPLSPPAKRPPAA